jgi:ketosteroid isomerase-like protein
MNRQESPATRDAVETDASCREEINVMFRIARTTFAAALAGLLGIAAAVPAAADEAADATKALWQQHLQSAMAGDVESATNDFAEDAVLYTNGHVFNGRAEIRSYVEEVVTALTPEALESMTVASEAYGGDTIFFSYTVGAWQRGGTNFLVVKDGKFIYGSSINYPAE